MCGGVCVWRCVSEGVCVEMCVWRCVCRMWRSMWKCVYAVVLLQVGGMMMPMLEWFLEVAVLSECVTLIM